MTRPAPRGRGNPPDGPEPGAVVRARRRGGAQHTIRPDIAARFRAVAARAIVRADREHAEHLAALRARPVPSQNRRLTLGNAIPKFARTP